MNTLDLDEYKNPGKRLAGLEESLEIETPQPEAESEDDFQLEVVDDTPEEDKGYKIVENLEAAESKEDDIESYSEKVKKRINKEHFKYQNERRAKELAQREREAAAELAKKALEEAEILRAKLDALSTTAKESTKGKLQSDLEYATQRYRVAYESGDSEALVNANKALLEAQIRLTEVDSDPRFAKPEKSTLQLEDSSVYSNKPVNVPEPDERVLEWVAENPWFQKDPLMTQFAQGLHLKMVESGKKIGDESYYSEIDRRLRLAFPDYEWPDKETPPLEPQRTVKKPTSVVASAGRTPAQKKVTLSASEVSLAKKLGISLEGYARQKALLGNK